MEGLGMSYEVRVEMEIEGGFDPFNSEDVDRVASRMEEYLRENDYRDEDFLQGLRDAMEGRLAPMSHQQVELIEGLMKFVSGGFPAMLFGMRGIGDRLDDVWVRYFRAGKVYHQRPKD